MRVSRLFAALAFLSLPAPLFAQLRCDVTCTPDTSSSTYTNGTFQARPVPANARSLSTPFAAHTAQDTSASSVTVGSDSFNYAIPILSLPGRNGLDVSLALYYNSRVWTIDNTNGRASFNADRDFPSYGFRLGYGAIEVSNSVYLLTEPDGSKRPFTGGLTTDSSYISWSTSTLTLRRKNGETWIYQRVGTTSFYLPVKIQDTNGNFLTITYHTEANFPNQAINSITDTIGRVITFNYDADAKLTSISATTPGVNGSKTYATFSWTQAPLNYNYSLTVADTSANGTLINVLSSCLYANQTGYSFAYGDWGIVNKISDISSNGTVRNYFRYDYPAASTGALADHPSFSHRFVSSDGTSASEVSTAFQQTRTAGLTTSMSVTDASGTTTTTNLYTTGWQTGLVSSVVANNGSTTLRTTATLWTQDNPNSSIATNPRVSSVTTTLNDSGQQSVSLLTYGTNGNVTELDDYDFTGLLMHKTQTDYLATTAYTNLHILDRPTQLRVYDRLSGLISRTDLAYDSTTLSGITTAANHDDTSFGTAFTTRGNVTQVTRYSNASAASGSVIRQFTYDTLGNQITAQLDCCQSEQRTFTSATQYAFPETITKGPAGTQLVTTRSYDPTNGNILSVTDENQQTTSFGYDSINRVTSVTRPGNIQTTTTFDDASSQPASTVARPVDSGKSIIAVSTADGLGRMIRQEIRDASQNVFSITETQYDSLGRVSQRSNPHGSSEAAVWTQNSYDSLGRIVKIIPPDGSVSSNNMQFQYLGNSVTVTDPAGKQRENFMDAAGRLVQVYEPGYDDGTHATATVTITGQEQSFFQPPTCHTRSCQFYDAGSVTVTANGFQVSVNYGQMSTAISIASALASGFNADANSPVSASAASGTLTLTAKFPGVIGNSYTLTKSSGGALNPPSFTVAITSLFSGGVDGTGSNGHPPSLATPLITNYYYDAMDNLTKTVQGVQQRTFVYDSMNRLTTATSPEAGAVSYTYTDFSTVATTTDARNVATALQYDGLHRLIGTGYTIPNGSGVAAMPNVCTPAGGQPANVCLAYGTSAASNNNGRLIQMTDPTGSESYSYDALGRTTQIQKILGGITYATGYQYNFADELTQINYPSGKQVAQLVDSLGRLSQIQVGAANYLSNVTYNAASQPLGATYGNGVQTTLTYNARLQLASLSYVKGASTLFSLGYDYTFGAAGNNGQIQKITDNVDATRTTTYTYDAWARLKTSATSQATITETYDRYGNRNQQSPPPSFIQSADPNTNRMPSPYAYDAAGNMTNDGLNALVYDGSSRVATSTQAGLTSTYSYDGGGLRVKKQVGSATATVYVFSGAKVIAEYSSGGAANAPLREYVYSGSQLLATIESGATKYYLNDHLSARVTTDSSGTKIGEQGHYPFGESWYSTNTTTKWQFTSYERDSESGNDYAMMRQYVNRLARFSSPDPFAGHLANPQSLNRYSYAGNDPINMIDPLGLGWECVTSSIGGQSSTTCTWRQGKCDTFLPGDCGGGGGGSSGGSAGGGQGPGGGGGGGGNGFCAGPACQEARRRILNDKKCREFIEKLLKALWAARTKAEENSGVFPGTKVKQARAAASTAEWFANRLNSASIVYAKTQPKDLPDAYAHVEGGGGVNTIVLDPFGAGKDRAGQIVHENFHIDPPDFSDIEAAAALGGPKFKTEASASAWWSPLLEAACEGQKKQ